MNRSETETQLVTPSSPHNSSSSSSSSSISCIGPYEALDSSEEERVLTPTYPWDYEECDNEIMEEGGQTCQIR